MSMSSDSGRYLNKPILSLRYQRLQASPSHNEHNFKLTLTAIIIATRVGENIIPPICFPFLHVHAHSSNRPPLRPDAT